MAHNPFIPPVAPVADVRPAPPPTRPWSLKLALILMWISQLSPLLGWAIDPASIPLPAGIRGAQLLIMMIIMLILAAMLVALILCVGWGQRWARIVYSALIMLSLIVALRGLPNFFEFKISFRVIYLLNAFADVATVILLFMPATNRWFGAVRVAAR